MSDGSGVELIRASADGATVAIGDIAGQAEQVMDNLATALNAVGAGFFDVVKTTSPSSVTPTSSSKLRQSRHSADTTSDRWPDLRRQRGVR
jgi:enamine deaminase RidA (YjgF/YER057c/UK114 family)